jgi:hypothetical protein
MTFLPTFTPSTLDYSIYALETSPIGQRVILAGIEWRILDEQDGKVLLISEKILECHPYNVEHKGITWENCTLRKYLNGEFLNKLGAVKWAIAETRNSNPNNQWYGTDGGNVTTDKVFLLSLDELIKYFGDSGDLRNKKRYEWESKMFLPSSSGSFLHDQYDNARMSYYGIKRFFWWLRSPGISSRGAAYVHGAVGVIGGIVSEVGGVRPALWVNL